MLQKKQRRMFQQKDPLKMSHGVASPRTFQLQVPTQQTKNLPRREQRKFLNCRSLKRQLAHADRVGARYVAIVGDGATTSLKEMDSGEQRELPPADVIPAILRGSRLV